jgi:hypothetical protein
LFLVLLFLPERQDPQRQTALPTSLDYELARLLQRPGQIVITRLPMSYWGMQSPMFWANDARNGAENMGGQEEEQM